ncbi:hypothetical protein PAXRUDRAFT_139184 [Paxillus rubicundulus Ve08.2h10]|uniref:Uncharacterized protein n=1 Tax=Paxillus rubicundulus Ve08.2h10 TaxID=930991 RepID=A0A0D0DEV5_9AGAM|nr:hypothetical protein PAXRUDRAFT_139184 [Paxillus rubicundulus Ve08.2h10]
MFVQQKIPLNTQRINVFCDCQTTRCLLTYIQTPNTKLLHGSIAEIAELTGCSEHTVFKILHLYCDFRHVNNPFGCHRGCPHSPDQHNPMYI